MAKYPPAVDIYAFGLCVLQLVTIADPWSEVKTEEELRIKKSAGELPAALETPGMDAGVRARLRGVMMCAWLVFRLMRAMSTLLRHR